MTGLAAVALNGCGGRFPEPTQHITKPTTPPNDTFIKYATWLKPGWQPTCVLLTRNGILLVAEDSARVQNYNALGSNGAAQPINIFRFNGLIKPVQVAEGNLKVYVADMGDGTPDHPIQIKMYDYSHGLDNALDPVATFTDTNWVRIKGITADLSQNIYVSCDAKVLVQNPPNPPAIDIQTEVYRYSGSYPGGVRDTVAEQGTGVGTLINAHQVSWRDGYLYVADTGKDWAQQLNPQIKNSGNFKVDGQEDKAPGPMSGPLGVAADLSAHFYVADTGNRQVLRYNYDGSFNQIVNQFGPDGMLAPTSLSAGVLGDKTYLYVADPTAHLINLYLFQGLAGH